MKTFEQAMDLAEEANKARNKNINYNNHKDDAIFWLEYAKILAIKSNNQIVVEIKKEFVL